MTYTLCDKAYVNDEKLRAEEHLRVIRSLMERGTIYRAISVPTALVGGLSAIAVSGFLSKGAVFCTQETREALLTTRTFVPPWIFALLVPGAANLWFLRRESSRSQRPFVSPGLRLALRSIVPSVLIAAVITLVI